MITIKSEKILKVLNIILLLVILISSYYLFYNFAVGYESGIFPSDLPAHIRSGMNGGGYSLMTKIFSWLEPLNVSKTLAPAILSIIVIGTVGTTFWCFKRMLIRAGIVVNKQIIILISIALLFISSIYISYFFPYFYRDSATTQPWHNSTYLLMRLLAVIVFGYYIKIEADYLNKIDIVDWVGFTVSLTLCNWSKPNFLIAFAPMMLVFLIADFIRFKTKGTIQMIKFGTGVLVSLLVCIIQSRMLWKPGSGNGVSFIPEGIVTFFTNENPFWIWIIVFGLLFPLVVTAVSIIRKNRSKMLIQGWVLYIISFLERLLLKEYGKRAGHGNFGWGRRITAYILFMICVVEAFQMYKKHIINKITLFIIFVPFVLSVVCGVVYFCILMSGNSYYI